MDTTFEEGKWDVTPEMNQCFDAKGFIIVRQLFNSDELSKIDRNVKEGSDYQKFMYMVKDREGCQSGQVTWNFPGDDVLGMAARCEKLAGTCAKLLGGEVYHYHSKICVKDAKTGGKRAWHQDYGYWYSNGCLFPDMMTVFLAVDQVTKENGCLQILEGSHKAGRIEHGFSGDEQGANVERVEHLKSKLPLHFVEMEPGDALFFHCNLLHTSGNNSSPGRRLAFLPAYNRASNDPVIDHHHARYNPLQIVPNKAVIECENYSNLDGKDFLDLDNLRKIKSSQVKFETAKQ